ncbi:MAG: hypothetical protein RJQ09_01670 [Cyclobacteriaceae bacterium]
MFVEFEQLPKAARVWIYQTDRELDEREISWLHDLLTSFCDQWAAHGQALKSSFQIRHNRFIILSVDEAASLPSGCSIDSSVHIIRQIEKELAVDMFNRTNVAFIHNNEIFVEPMTNLKGKIQDGVITKDTLTFNNLVKCIDDLESSWKVPAKSTWLKKYFG